MTAEQTVADFPATMFPFELMAAYPEAKVIIAVRDEDAWYKSMVNTLIHAQHDDSPANREVKALGKRTVSVAYHEWCWDNNFEANGREYFRSYYQALDDALPSKKALRFDVRSGWGPLCEYLGVPIPDSPWPSMDDWRKYKAEHGLA